ncbi:DUF2218 domain-containing protein [Actinospica robiniae]|uniref:DUF2218 domain-containing protein n=1 Tax=Actinospica robiniae TaxID=304901 RepID=UPI00040F63F9|nr:DUF2218 domain-containing protein [Actinospica robiniae]
MPAAETRIPTDRAARYLEQLCSHLGSMQHMRHLPSAASASGHGNGHGPGEAGMPRVENVEKNGNHAVIRFADGSWDLTAHEDELLLRVEADEDAALERLKGAIAARIAKIGRRDGLSVHWSSDHEPHDPQSAAEGRPARGRGSRGRLRTLGWCMLAALAVAIHLGLIGSLLGGGRSKDVAADAIIALIVVKLILLGLHARFGRGRPHHRNSSPDTSG